MLEDHNLFNADILESSLFDFASKFILKKEQSGKDVTHYISMMKYLKNIWWRSVKIYCNNGGIYCRI